MHGDFSSVTFDRRNRFSAVMALQGRVSVDSDHNEHSAILLHYLRTLAVDVLGRHAWPSQQPGFGVGLVTDDAGDVTDLSIGAGRCYVDGLLVENFEADGETPTTFYAQPDAHFTPSSHKLPLGAPFFVFLQTWERLVTYAQNPAFGRVACGSGGPDSSARSKVMWQVRCGDALSGSARNVPGTRDTALDYWAQNIEPLLLGNNTGKLTAMVRPDKEDELCARSPDAGYRGLENQLYRVEIHTGGVIGAPPGSPAADPPTFVWSRDNGSVIFPMVRDGSQVTLTSLGRDQPFRLSVGDWVELVDDISDVNWDECIDLRQIVQIDPRELRVTLDAAPTGSIGTDPSRHPLLRRWDQQPSMSQRGAANAVQAGSGSFALEDGIEITFGDGSYRAGDYWTFTACTETGDIGWPQKGGVPVPRTPDGIERHFVPLALITGADPPDVIDLRAIVKPLAATT